MYNTYAHLKNILNLTFSINPDLKENKNAIIFYSYVENRKNHNPDESFINACLEHKIKSVSPYTVGCTAQKLFWMCDEHVKTQKLFSILIIELKTMFY